MNITDVGHLTSDADEGEDKMIKAMRREGKSPWDIARFYTGVFLEDYDRLNLIRAEFITPATEHIPDMIALIQCLVDGGHAYLIKDGVYFDVSTFPEYGKLSKQPIEEQEAGARVEVNREKHNPADFALWKTSEPSHIMQWDSPWGRGYPGWHIECSAMSMKYLGETFDIHCGGVDHIPIHHENEIAQSEACTGKEFVRYWMHGEFLLIDSGKMSKSAGAAGERHDMGEGIESLTAPGGFLTLQNLVDVGLDALAYRYFCFTAKYRAQLNYTDEAIHAAANALDNLYDFVARTLPLETKGGDLAWQDPYRQRFLDAINDDLNMPGALAVLHELITEANRRGDPASALELTFDWDRVFGLKFKERGQERMSAQPPPDVMQLIEERQAARKARDWARADDLRAQVRAAGWEIEDTPQGVRWKRAG
jgi:cysteinyl-tRNA synthetase